MSVGKVRAVGLKVEDFLLPLLVQLAVIVLAARLFAVGFRWIGQPGVVGEVAAGLLLGPSVLGRFLPGVFDAIFHPTVPKVPVEQSNLLFHWVLISLSQLGLIFLLFLIGLELDLRHLRLHGKTSVATSIAGIAVPFALGLGLAHLLEPYVEDVSPVGFALFLGTALSITAIPVLGRIMLELNITRTRLGAITMGAAAVDDAAGWILLATVAAVVQTKFELGRTMLMAAETIGFALLMFFVAGPLVRAWAQHVLQKEKGQIGASALALLLAGIFACAIITNLIGIFSVFGAFVLGAVLSSVPEFREAIGKRLRDFVSVFFLPLFFVYTGLRTDIGNLASGPLWLWCGLVTFAAVLGKLGGCGLAAWLTGLRLREAACVGVMMNTRGLMALIAINLGKDLGVVPDTVFAMLILMALLTTIMTTPLLLRLMPGTELEPYILQSEFVRGPACADEESRPPPAKKECTE